jgi:tRNA threonylcarbamoyladenosine biosynthesis protein TsaB
MNFRCLALETATDLISLSACHGKRSATWERQPAREETPRIYQHAERVLAEVGLKLPELDCVAFGCGPGSFTGVRVAASAAQALAFALGVRVCRRSSLAILAAGIMRRTGQQRVAVCLDARMERAYLALYRAEGGRGVVPVIGDELIDPRVYQLEGQEAFVAAGPGWNAYPALGERHAGRITHLIADALPSSTDLLAMAIDDYQAGALVTAEQALPEYLGLVPASVAEVRR